MVVACSSLYDFCVHRLGMSGGASQRRIIAARLARRFPSLLAYLEDGTVNLSHVLALRDHLTEENVEELVKAVSKRTLREVAVILTARTPRPDVPEALEDLGSPPGEGASAWSAPASSVRSARLQPLSERRCLLQVTVSAELRRKLEQARDLVCHRSPKGDLETVIDAALDVLLAKLEKERHGKVAKPQPAPLRPTKEGTISRAVRREVCERDGFRCTFVDAQDRRCPARAVFGKEHVAERIHDRRERSSPETSEAVYEAALRQLLACGFGRARAQPTLETIGRRPARTVEELVSEAIDVLCPDMPPTFWPAAGEIA